MKICIILLLLMSCENDTIEKKKSKVDKQLLWSIGVSFSSSATLNAHYVPVDSSVFVGRDSSIIKIHSTSGSILWKTNVSDYKTIRSENINVDTQINLVLYRDSHYRYGILNFMNGNVLLKRDDVSSSSYYSDQTTNEFIIARGRSRFFTVNKFDFSETSFQLEDSVHAFSIIADDKLYLGVTGRNNEIENEANGGIYALDLTTKSIAWKYIIPPLKYANDRWYLSGFINPLIVVDNYIYGGSSTNGILVCLNKSTGAIIWEKKYSADINKIAYTDNYLFAIEATAGILRGYNRLNGTVLWERDIPGSTSSDAYAYKGWFYYIEPSVLTVIDPLSGTTVYKYKLSKSVRLNSISFGGDKVFIDSFEDVMAVNAYHNLK